MTDPIIDVKNLKKSYGKFLAVSDVSFHISPGDFFGLLGPNGAGKTTTIGMITGIIPPTAGHVIIDGQPLDTVPKICKSKIGLVPQDFAFYPSLNAMDNLVFFGNMYALHGKHLKRRIEEVLEIVLLSNHRRQPVATFSNGMKRRLNIAIGLLNEPRILILDEPTVGVDAQSRSAIFDSLKALNEKGMTVIYTTHYMEEAQALCRRIAIIDKGRIIRLDTPAALMRELSDSVVKIQFGGPVEAPLFTKLQAIGSLSPLDDTGRWILMKTVHPAKTVAKILNLPEVKKIGIHSLDITNPNLEDVFLHLTGHTLRDN